MGELLLLVAGAFNPIAIQQKDVVPVINCGFRCHIETTQLSLPERRKDGWISIEVIRKRRIVLLGRDRSVRTVRNRRQWLFANCQEQKFGTGEIWNRNYATVQDAFHRDFGRLGHPKFESVYGSPFLQWAKLCPKEATHGLRFLQRNYTPNFKPKKIERGC